jgi:hypothetical protein
VHKQNNCASSVEKRNDQRDNPGKLTETMYEVERNKQRSRRKRTNVQEEELEKVPRGQSMHAEEFRGMS